MRLVPLLFTLALTPALQAQAAPSLAAPAPFAQLRQAWATSLQARTLDASLALYASDAVFINPDGTHTTNPAELRQLYTFIFDAFSAAAIELTSRSTGQSADLAFDSGSYTETLTETSAQPGQGIHHLSGDYLTLYRRSSVGRWLIVQQVWTQAHHPAAT